MPYDPERHHRRSIRLRGYDYSQPGAYFVTINVQGRLPLLGSIEMGAMQHSPAGMMAAAQWQALPERFAHVTLDVWVVMPDHIHGIILLHSNAAQPGPALGGVIGAFKSLTTHAYIQGVETQGWPPFPGRLWQRNYYERIVRDEAALE
ncbi:transposase, partial [Oscillochloris sp. ZM17-4]|uniref:transposase n=1 Tax=Oscillochloris sp. ZM17-4 TaxID=2866714 RepID=UPI001C72B46A